MRRFASIDFLRGVAIILMIFLHTILYVLDVDGLLDRINDIPSINLIAFIVLPYIGGMAGFFLMVSAIGNMVSMFRHLQAEKSVKDLAIRQIMGGILLLIFAMLSESILSWHGAVGNLMRHLDDPSRWNWDAILYRGYHFETIHTIAWCIILNGIVQAILSRNNGWKDPTKLIKKYVMLLVIILVLTPIMWALVSLIIPGYPFAEDPRTGRSVQYPVIGISEPWEFVLLLFLGPIAGELEPVFPYLASSFIGSIIGITISQERETVNQNFPRRMMQVGFILFLVGTIGLVINIVLMMDIVGMNETLDTYVVLSNHRYWVPENGVPILGWLFQFMSLNGAAICAVMIVIRVVEFRGIGKEFAEKTKFVRRFGFVAFTIYNIQWLFFVMHFIVTSLFYGEPYMRLDWGGAILTLCLVFLLIHGILLLWERIKYTGSLEWCMGTIAALIIPSRKAKTKWWQAGQLNIQDAFYNAEWLNIVEKEEIAHDDLKDSKLAYKISWFGFIFLPLSFISYFIAKGSITTEKENKYNKRGKIIALAGMIFCIAWVIITLVFSLSDLGISL